ncbi:MAG: FAD-dependent oxidoreductase [Bacteriovoracaceae bacterium]|nr:FAD-dependent oxidoreductase [Bacteriovoracaceae bacterium]
MKAESTSTSYDLIIIGAGISGTSLFYLSTEYSNLKNIAIFDKNSREGAVNSHRVMNSQTLHFGDIETNYSYQKAQRVNAAANMVKRYLDAHRADPNESEQLFSVVGKMVVAEGEQEVRELKTRYEDIKQLFEKITYLERDEIEKIEPLMIKGRPLNVPVAAIYTPDGYTIDFQALAKHFVQKAKKKNPDIAQYMNAKIVDVQRFGEGYKVINDQGIEYTTKTLVISACGHSLLFAHSLGIGKHLNLLSVAGSFYESKKTLHNKVYTMQNPKLPFAAIHGDPDVYNTQTTRWGPTAKPIPLLERYNWSTFFEYLRGITPAASLTLFKVLSDWDVFKYVIKNTIFDIPVIGKYFFVRDARKIVPTLKSTDLVKLKRCGGTRPQIIDTKTKTLNLGEAKLTDKNLIINITPSPGASTCLSQAHGDLKLISEFLPNITVDWDRLKNDLGV